MRKANLLLLMLLTATVPAGLVPAASAGTCSPQVYGNTCDGNCGTQVALNHCGAWGRCSIQGANNVCTSNETCYFQGVGNECRTYGQCAYQLVENTCTGGRCTYQGALNSCNWGDCGIQGIGNTCDGGQCDIQIAFNSCTGNCDIQIAFNTCSTAATAGTWTGTLAFEGDRGSCAAIPSVVTLQPAGFVVGADLAYAQVFAPDAARADTEPFCGRDVATLSDAFVIGGGEPCGYSSAYRPSPDEVFIHHHSCDTSDRYVYLQFLEAGVYVDEWVYQYGFGVTHIYGFLAGST